MFHYYPSPYEIYLNESELFFIQTENGVKLTLKQMRAMKMEKRKEKLEEQEESDEEMEEGSENEVKP